MPAYAWLGLAICLGVAGQLVLKNGAEAPGEGVLAQFLSPWTIAGLGVYFLAAITYIVALKRIPVSLAYPSVSLSYGILAVLAHLIWKEPLSWQHAGGILLIMSGIFVLFRA
ncbi:MAG TPA: EamA family transporter [Aliidongia sp.]|nr:EamA family transporter [Aliidongia sp.]